MNKNTNITGTKFQTFLRRLGDQTGATINKDYFDINTDQKITNLRLVS